MGFWTNKDHRTFLDDLDDLAHQPKQSPWTKWFTGCLVPSLILVYVLHTSGEKSMRVLSRTSSLVITGDDVHLLCAAYLSIAVFIHAHCFWNLSERLEPYAEKLKVLSLLVFIPCVCIVFWHQILW